jgi:CheY-like chemotaxis protein
VGKVLVVDDDPSLRVVLRLVLETEGKGLPDVVTTDLTMAVLGGKELIRHLRSDPATAAIPIVVISGNQDGARALHAWGLVKAVLIKPSEAAKVARCIKDVTGNAAVRQATA